MELVGTSKPTGKVGLRVRRNYPSKSLSIFEIIKYGFPYPSLEREVFVWRLKNLKNLFRGLRRVVLAKLFGIPTHYGQLFLTVHKSDGRKVAYGLASLRVVTNNGVAFIVDAFQNTTEVENLRYHGFGTGTNSESSSDTALQTELTTQYSPDNTRPTGSLTESASNVFRTVATLDPDANVAITEHGIFSQAATGGGTLLDRSVFSAINLNATGDTLESTYDLTFSAGG